MLIPGTQGQPINEIENRKRNREHIPAAFVGEHTEIGFLALCRLGTSHTARDQIAFTRGSLFSFVPLLAD